MPTKKHNSRKQKRKPRIPVVSIGFDRDVAISYIHFGDGRKLILKDENGNLLEPSVATVGDAYLRGSKPKVLRQLRAEPTDIRLDVRCLLRSQDATLAVDTNYHDFDGFRLCISTSILILYRTEKSRRMADFFPQASLVFGASNTNNPERFGWWDIIERFSTSPYYDPAKSYGLVVDSDLHDLAAINTGNTPVWEQHYLPAGFQLIYASADAGRENYINQAINMCDKSATRVLSLVLPGVDEDKIREGFSRTEYLRLCYVRFRNEA